MIGHPFKLPFRFHTKIFIALGGMVCISIICILFILQETTQNRIQDNIRERFQGSQAAFKHLQDLRRQFVVKAINNLTTSNAQFRSILSTASVSSNELGLEKRAEDGDLLTDANLRLNSLLPFLPMYREFDIFIVANADGTLLFSKAATRRSGDDISDLPLFEQFGENEEAEDIWFSNTRDVARFLMPANPQMPLTMSSPNRCNSGTNSTVRLSAASALTRTRWPLLRLSPVLSWHSIPQEEFKYLR
jgi:hypothetical protein